MTLNRFGEEDDDTTQGQDVRECNRVTAGHSCRNGWLGEDQDGRLIPCLRCKPHLVGTSRFKDCDPEIR